MSEEFNILVVYFSIMNRLIVYTQYSPQSMIVYEILLHQNDESLPYILDQFWFATNKAP